MTPSLFEDLAPRSGEGAERIPLERINRRHLLADLVAISGEAVSWVVRSKDPELAQFLSRVVLLVEQTRVHLGGRAA